MELRKKVGMLNETLFRYVLACAESETVIVYYE